MVEQEAVDTFGLFLYSGHVPDKRTYADRREYLKKAVAKRRKKIRQIAIDFLGGNCCYCQYDRCSAALDFHHIDKSQKKFGLSQSGMTRSWEKTKQELQKCILVCSNCHREIHAGLLQPSAAMLNGKLGELSQHQ